MKRIKKMGVVWISMICLSVLFGSGCGEQTQVSETPAALTIGMVTEAPVIDGILTDSCWDSLETVMLVRCDTGGEPVLPTSLRAGYDSEKLYIGFECQDPDAVSTVDTYDGPVYAGDHVAVYLDANSDTTTYALIEVAPNGTVRDAFVLSRSDGSSRMYLADWRCEDMRVAVNVYGGDASAGTEDRFWTVEMAIPFASLITAPRIPVTGDAWRANIYRADAGETREYSAMTPTGSDSFHRPEAFGIIRYE